MSYNASTFVSQYAGLAKPTGQIGITQTVFTPGYAAKNAIVWDKEMRGGVHRVDYKGLLIRDDIYDGIFPDRRVKGMLCYVDKLDDGSQHGGYYSLASGTGMALTDWQLIGTGASINLNTIGGTATLTTLYELTASNGDFYNVSDARTAQEVSDGATPYSRSFIYSSQAKADGGQGWLPVYGNLDPNAHAKGYDATLWAPAHGAFVTANALFDHLQDTNLHHEINDLHELGGAKELYSSLKIRALLAGYVPRADPASFPDPTKVFLAGDGKYYPVTGGSFAGGLLDMGGA